MSVFDKCIFYYQNGYELISGQTLTKTGSPSENITGRMDINNATSVNGTSQWIRCTNSAFAVGTGDFTISFWAYETGTPNYGTFMSLSTATTYGNDQFKLRGETSLTQMLVAHTAANSYLNFTRAQNQWNHWMITKTGSIYTVYYNGVQAGATFTDSSSITSTYLMWGGDYVYYLQGKFDEIMFFAGIALTPTTLYELTKNKYIYPYQRGERRYE